MRTQRKTWRKRDRDQTRVRIPLGRCSLVASGHAANREGEVLSHQRTNPVGDSNPCSLQWPLGSDSQLCYAPWRGRSTRRGFASAEPEVAFEVVVVVVVAVSVGGDDVVGVDGRKVDDGDFLRRFGFGCPMRGM